MYAKDAPVEVGVRMVRRSLVASLSDIYYWVTLPIDSKIGKRMFDVYVANPSNEEEE